MRSSFNRAAICLMILLPNAASACPDCEYEACIFSACACLPKSGCILPGPINDIVNTVANIPRLVVTNAAKAIQDVSETIKKAFDDTVRTIDKAGKDIELNVDKAGKDAEGELARFELELESAGRGVGKYVDGHKQISSELDKAIQRTREGKLLDAIWHAALSPIVVQEHSASAAVLESSYLRAMGQVAATAYGGPSGAAAYSAWLTYRETGDPSLALRAAVLTGAAAWANGQISSNP